MFLSCLCMTYLNACSIEEFGLKFLIQDFLELSGKLCKCCHFKINTLFDLMTPLSCRTAALENNNKKNLWEFRQRFEFQCILINSLFLMLSLYSTHFRPGQLDLIVWIRFCCICLLDFWGFIFLRGQFAANSDG